ncbi:glycosyltransferase family 39 protein [Kamptonema sp. UHCC 0994]|uniref:glycosyltransferase family 39 protein n=1 Tax=Kamptonema sp. UHCC 0994 TaxID=3031329 RepID=UPI0023B918C1|nr:glycosyltransferase family 39 protein [Kamptonema sp. UHCC 0994]MDF0554979.1 glycosyltransferase family 39 protein [Kamptonema sp. UHCC 0994]
MESKLTPSEWLPPTWLRFILITILILGIFFRFANLDSKAYWFDETSTSLQISGYTDNQVTEQILDGRVIDIQTLNKYQYPSPEKTAADTMKGLAVKEPQLTPLYFVITRFWVQLFGNSVAATRSFSAAASLLAFPCIYWLCIELFKSPLTGWIAIALLSVSPFHLLYAQEARPYSLWTVAILLSNITLLRAIRLQNINSWILYAATIIFGIYSFLFSALVIIAHGIYILTIEGFRLSKTLIRYVIASLVGVLAFIPWIIFALINVQKTNEGRWGTTSTSVVTLIKSWIRGISLFFADFSLNDDSPSIYFIPFTAAVLIIFILVVYAIYFLYRHSPKQVWLFIFISITIPALALIVPDLILGGSQSTIARYLLPSYLAMQLAVAYLFANKLSNSVKPQLQKMWQVALIMLISIGIFSCAVFSESEIWWSKAEGNVNYHLAQVINKANQPLVISDAYFVKTLAFSHYLEPKVRFQLVVEPKIPQIADGFNDVFIYDSSQTLRDELDKKYKLQLVETGYSIKNAYNPTLWRLVKQ